MSMRERWSTENDDNLSGPEAATRAVITAADGKRYAGMSVFDARQNDLPAARLRPPIEQYRLITAGQAVKPHSLLWRR
jgi:hypothetical protein